MCFDIKFKCHKFKLKIEVLKLIYKMYLIYKGFKIKPTYFVNLIRHLMKIKINYTTSYYLLQRIKKKKFFN